MENNNKTGAMDGGVAPEPPKAPTPPPKAAETPPAPVNHAARKVAIKFRKPDLTVGHRVLVYGKPGVGKTTMMLRDLPRPLVAFDFDQSIERLLQNPNAAQVIGGDMGDIYLADIARDKEGRLDYGDFLSTIRASENFEGVRSILIDTGTFAEQAIEPYLFEHPDKFPTGNSKCPKARSLADYAFRGGNLYKQDLYKLMLDYLTSLTQVMHLNVGILYHTAVGKVPNLTNADGYSLQYQSDSWYAGKTSLAETAMGWADHVGAIRDDTVADGKDGKVQRIVGRVISFQGDGEYIGKSRTLSGDAATIPLSDFSLAMLGVK